MKFVLIHGDDEVASRKRFLVIIDTLKNKGWRITRIRAGKDKNLTDKLITSSLFSENELFIIEDANKLKTNEIQNINKNCILTKGSLLFYSSTTTPAGFIKSLPKSIKIEEFKLPKKIFVFLESFFPGNSQTILNLLHEIVRTDNPEFVFAMVTRHFRDLYWATNGAGTLNYPSWRLSKLTRQAEKFHNNQLSNIISKFAEIDIITKTSKELLMDNLDLLIIQELK